MSIKDNKQELYKNSHIYLKYLSRCGLDVGKLKYSQYHDNINLKEILSDKELEFIFEYRCIIFNNIKCIIKDGLVYTSFCLYGDIYSIYRRNLHYICFELSGIDVNEVKEKIAKIPNIVAVSERNDFYKHFKYNLL